MTKTMVGGMLTWLCGLAMLMALLGSGTSDNTAEEAATLTPASEAPARP